MNVNKNKKSLKHCENSCMLRKNDNKEETKQLVTERCSQFKRRISSVTKTGTVSNVLILFDVWNENVYARSSVMIIFFLWPTDFDYVYMILWIYDVFFPITEETTSLSHKTRNFQRLQSISYLNFITRLSSNAPTFHQNCRALNHGGENFAFSNQIYHQCVALCYTYTNCHVIVMAHSVS